MRLKKPIPAELQSKIIADIKAGKSPGEIKANIADLANISLRRAHDYYKHVQELGTAQTPSSSDVDPKSETPADAEKDWAESLLFDGDYVYNKEEDKYIVYLKSANRHIVVPGERHRMMLQAYSNWDGNPATINEICRNFEFPRSWFTEYKTIMGWTHDREPITNEELENRDEDDIIQDLLQRKRFAVYQKFQKADWKATQEDATKWRAFQTKQLDPFQSALTNWNPPPVTSVNVDFSKPSGDKWFVCGCFDWQVGSKADGKYLFRQKDWGTADAINAIHTFAERVAADVTASGERYAGCEILLGGDLHHGFHGRTAKGTPLEVDTLREDQFDALLSCISYLIETLSQVFEKVNVRAVRGNHDGFDFYPVMKAVELYFRNTSRIEFFIYSARTALFRVGPVLMVLDHGASDVYKAEIPKHTGNGKARESYIQSLLLSHPDQLVGVKQKIFVQGDKHHYEQLEYNDFESFMFGALPLGDKYADNLNLHGRPRQNCLVIDENGVKSVLHYYFD